jgi:hypothetical protein
MDLQEPLTFRVEGWLTEEEEEAVFSRASCNENTHPR